MIFHKKGRKKKGKKKERKKKKKRKSEPKRSQNKKQEDKTKNMAGKEEKDSNFNLTTSLTYIMTCSGRRVHSIEL